MTSTMSVPTTTIDGCRVRDIPARWICIGFAYIEGLPQTRHIRLDNTKLGINY